MSNYCSTVIGLYIHWQRLIDQFEHKVNVHKYDPLWRHGDSTIELSNGNFTTSCSRHPVSCVAMEDIGLISDTHWFLVMGLCLLLYTWANPEGCIENNQRNLNLCNLNSKWGTRWWSFSFKPTFSTVPWHEIVSPLLTEHLCKYHYILYFLFCRYVNRSGMDVRYIYDILMSAALPFRKLISDQ